MIKIGVGLGSRYFTVASAAAAFRGINTFATCFDYSIAAGATIYYIRNTDYASILTDGTKLYIDADGSSDELPVNSFVYNNYSYIYSQSEGTTMIGVCGTPSPTPPP